MERVVQLTSDGSSTIYIPEMDETYHSSHGAIQEAKHVFLKNGIETLKDLFLEGSEISVFEMGFGTGLNALLTCKYAEEAGVNIDYTGIEAFPVGADLIESLNYVSEIGMEFKSDFELMHSGSWNEKLRITSAFQLTKIHEKVQDYLPVENSIDIIYFDAFGPRAQADMWDISILEKMRTMLKPNGVLVTYCAMGQFKRDLKSLGFVVEGRPGPPGKREMTVGLLRS